MRILRNHNGRPKMKAIYLNHTQTKAAQPASWALLLLGAASLFIALWMIQHLKQENAKLQAKLAARQVQGQPQRAIVVLPDARSEAVKMAIQHIVIPWASLLKALEAANHEGVKMLTLEPNDKTRTVKLSLIALDQDSMWAYLENLKTQTVLQEVRLVSNESVEINGALAQAFWVEAKWQN